jgi:hypothetical protein
MTNYWRIERDIEIVQGKTWTAKFRWSVKSCKGKTSIPIDLSAYTAKFVIRETAENSASLLEISDGNGITLGADGTIEVTITATQAANLTVGENVWELELQTGTTVIAFGHGVANVYQEVAHD